MRFVHDTPAQRVRFATGGAQEQLAREVADRGAARVLVVASRRDEPTVAALTEGLPVAARVDEVVRHVPAEVAARARAIADSSAADLLLSIGGGSATGLAKAIALSTGLPIVAVPTTYAASEATDIWGLTDGSVKSTGTHPAVLPQTVVYDAELSRSLPVPLTVASGINALAHCVDSVWAPRAEPLNRVWAIEGARVLVAALEEVVDRPDDLGVRERLLQGAYLSGLAFSSAGSGLHHKVCHVLGGRWDLPHAETHAVVLPYVLAFNAPALDPQLRAALGAALGPEPVAALDRLGRRLDAPRSLRELGAPGDDLAGAAAAAHAALPAGNPRTVTVDDLETLLTRAWNGEPAS